MRWLIVCLLLSCSLFGQVNDRRRVESVVFNKQEAIKSKMENALWRFGSLHLTPVLGVKNFGYDSNVLSQEVDEQEDFQITPHAGLQSFHRINRNWIWSNQATYGYRYYFDLDRFRTPEYTAETRLYGLFRRVYMEAGAQYTRDQRRLTSEIDERVNSERLSLQMNLALQVTPRGHLILDGDFNSIDFEDSELLEGQVDGFRNLRNLERDATAVTGTYLYKMKPQFWPFFGASITTFDFDSLNNIRDNSDFTGVFIGARNEVGRRLHFDVTLGIEDLQFEGAPHLDTTVFKTESLLSYKFTRKWEGIWGAVQDPIFSTGNQFLYFVSRRVFAELGYRTRKEIQIGPRIKVGENRYLDQPFTQGGEDRKDDLLSYELVVSFPIKRSFRWEFSAGYSERDSNIDIFSYDGFTLSSEVSLKLRK